MTAPGPENHDQTPPPGVPLGPGVRVPQAALRVAYVRSSGPGGQNVNKRATKAQLRVLLDDIPLAPGPRARLERLAKTHLTDAGELLIQDDTTRSPTRNKAACMERLRELVVRALVPPKQRRPTKPGRGAVQRRLDEKKQRSQAKERRRRPDAP